MTRSCPWCGAILEHPDRTLVEGHSGRCPEARGGHLVGDVDLHTAERRERVGRRQAAGDSVACDTAELYDRMAQTADEVGWRDVASAHRATAARLRADHES